VLYGDLQPLPVAWLQARSLVELDLSMAILAEHAVEDEDVEVKMSVEGGSEPVEE